MNNEPERVERDRNDDEKRYSQHLLSEKEALGYVAPALWDLMPQLEYKRGWAFTLGTSYGPDGSGGLVLRIIALTDDSFNFGNQRRTCHEFLVPRASYNRNSWVAWVFARICDVERHEAGEFFRVDGVREFAPHHGNGEDPYITWHVSDWATAAKSAGDE